MNQDFPDRAEVIALPPVLCGGILALGLVLHFRFPCSFLPPQLGLWSGSALVAVATLLVVAAFRALAQAKTSFDVSKPTTAIVTYGPYRYSRNPMYMAMLMLYLGIALLLNSLWMVVLIGPLVVLLQRGVINREEQYLARKFGEDYRRYRAQVRRWL